MRTPVAHGPDSVADSDDLVLPFRTVRSGVIGRLVRLGAGGRRRSCRATTTPQPCRRRSARPWRSTALLGTALKFDGKLILQTKTDGPLDFLVVNYEAPGRLRGYARFDAKRVGAR